jgi:hypothetical protein
MHRKKEVDFLQQQPPAWPQGGDHTGDSNLRNRKMMEEPTSVYEIELAGRQRFRENVVASRLKVGVPVFH